MTILASQGFSVLSVPHKPLAYHLDKKSAMLLKQELEKVLHMKIHDKNKRKQRTIELHGS
jgi:hypothetical protein